MVWTKEGKEMLKRIYSVRDFNKESEMAEQLFVSDYATEHIRNWIRGRWEYYIANLNSTCSILIAYVDVDNDLTGTLTYLLEDSQLGSYL